MRKKSVVFICAFALTYHLFAQSSSYVGIGLTTPLANLDVARGTSNLGTAMFRGTVNASHFNYGTTEETYIRGGKGTSNVIINDVGNNVGIGVGDPAYKLDVGNRMRLRSQPGNITAGIWFNNYDNTAITGFIGEVGSGAPNHLGIYGNTSGWQFVMNTVSGNVGINTLNTTAGNGKLNVRSTTDGNAIKLIGNSQYISFFDEANNPKGYVWNDANNMVISTSASNLNGEIQLYSGNGGGGITIQNDGRVKAGALACTIPATINGVATLPKVTVQGALGIKKSFGDQIGEWAIHYDELNDLLFSYNGGFKAVVDNADGSWITFSDRSLKEDFNAYKPVLNDLLKLPVLTYHYKSTTPGIRNFGLIAQDVQRYFPEIISNGPGGLLGIDYSKIGVLAIKAIQEQQVMIESQQKKIEELEKRLVSLEERIR